MKYYKVMLGKGSKYANDCYNGKFIGGDYGIEEKKLLWDTIEISACSSSLEMASDRFFCRSPRFAPIPIRHMAIC